MTGTLLERGASASRDPTRGHTQYTVRPRAGDPLVGAYVGLQGQAWIEGTADTGLRPEGAAAILRAQNATTLALAPSDTTLGEGGWEKNVR